MRSKRDIIDETVACYSKDPEGLRSKSEKHGCRYLSDNGNTCAIGRCLIDPNSFSGVEGIGANMLFPEFLESHLLPCYRGHEKAFWLELQNLHDRDEHWCSDGLTDKGKEFVSELYRRWC